MNKEMTAVVEELDVDCRECGACCVAVHAFNFMLEVEEQHFSTWSKKRRELYLLPGQRGNLRRLRVVYDTKLRLNRCRALKGEVGESVTCAVYEQRPAPCRAYAKGSEACLMMRESLGL